MTFKHIARSIIVLALLVAMAAPLAAATPRTDTPVTPPRVSPLGHAAQVVGITGISVTYGRPAVKERKIWGELVPLGKVWRAGANDATVISFSDDVKIEGKDLAAGTYALFTIPDKDTWTVIFNKEAEQWGAFQYKDSEDVLRVEVKARSGEHRELLTIDFPEAGENETTMRIAWEKVEVPVRIRASMDNAALLARVLSAVEANPDDVGHLWEWVAFLSGKEITAPEMPGWASRIVEAYPGYYTLSLEATVLAQAGRMTDAVATGEKALETGKEQLGKNAFLTEAQLETFNAQLTEWKDSTD